MKRTDGLNHPKNLLGHLGSSEFFPVPERKDSVGPMPPVVREVEQPCSYAKFPSSGVTPREIPWSFHIVGEKMEAWKLEDDAPASFWGSNFEKPQTVKLAGSLD